MSANMQDLSKYRYDRAVECLSDAQFLLSNQRYNGAANRSYYAVFQAMKSVLALDGIDMKKHSGIMSEFRKRYVKTGIFDSRMSEIISSLFNLRQESDYDDFYVVSIAEVHEQVNDAEYFINEVKFYLEKMY